MLFPNRIEFLGIVDSFALSIYKFARVPFYHTFSAHDVSLAATYEYCISKKETYCGHKVHALITFYDLIKTFEFISASVDNRKALPDLVENQGNLVILGDKGYVSQSLKEALANKEILFLRWHIQIVSNLLCLLSIRRL